MIQGILNVLFSCGHKKRSWPQADSNGAYQVCLQCGKRIAYRNRELVGV